MKRVISFFMMVVLLILLCGCGAAPSSVGERPEDVREELWDYACEILQTVDKYLDKEITRQNADDIVTKLCDDYSSALHALDDATLKEWTLDMDLMSISFYLTGIDARMYTVQDLLNERNEKAARHNYPLKTSIK